MNERRIEIDFEIGETVKVNEGPFANFTGSIEEIDKDKAKVKVLSICLVEIRQLNSNLHKLKNYKKKT